MKKFIITPLIAAVLPSSLFSIYATANDDFEAIDVQ